MSAAAYYGNPVVEVPHVTNVPVSVPVVSSQPSVTTGVNVPVITTQPAATIQPVVQDWVNSTNRTLAFHSNDKRSWSHSFWACCTPASLCCLTCCCPHQTFGKTHFRLENNGSMQGYSRFNLPCLLFCMSQSFCAHAILIAIQRRDVRRTYNIKGSSIGDCCKSCCCPCCSLIQSEKETGESRPGFGGDGSVIDEQYKAETARMVMKTKTLPAPVQRGPPSGQTGSQEPEPKGEEVRAAPAPKQNEKVKEESGQSQPTLQPVTTHTTPTQLIREAQLALSLAQEQIQD